MRHAPSAPPLDASKLHLLLVYVADLELEVDRLRNQAQFIHHEVRETLRFVHGLCTEAIQTENALPRTSLSEIDRATHELAVVMRDLQDLPGYHPTHDQVIAIAVRPLVERVFRSQQRLLGVPEVILRLELASEYVEWFPARLRHILDNLFSNAVKSRDPGKDEAWVHFRLRVSPEGYELQVSDNGIGLPAGQGDRMFELFHRAGPARAAGLGVGLPVVKMLVEQSGGTLAVESGEGQGSTFTVVLPRYDVDDYLT
jgi:signal transduction histidine kinase